MPLTTLAHDLGFADLAHMSRSVRALTSFPPSAWRSDASLEGLAWSDAGQLHAFKTRPRTSSNLTPSMDEMNRRRFLSAAASLGASFVGCHAPPQASRVAWIERRDVFPEGVASGDPTPDSVLLWTRRPYADGRRVARLRVEVADDEAFARVVAASDTWVSAGSDWTCRALVGGLSPGRAYAYRFTDEQGFGSRVGRTITAPADDDGRPVHFAFVSCQNVNQGRAEHLRRLIHADEAAPPEDRLAFVLHLGDFIYELVWYPEDRPQGMYDRRLRDVVRYATGQRIEDFHVPTTVDDYRAVYRAYLHDPDIQDARARWPFVSMWDNHEFSWLGWQGLQVFGGKTLPAQTRKVAANQAWFEYQPARVKKPVASLASFDPPRVVDAPVTAFDADGLGLEPNNQAAIRSLVAYRAFRWGKHVELFITDQHSFRSEDASARPEMKAFSSKDFPELVPEEVLEVLDGGRSFRGPSGGPPATLRFDGKDVPNFFAQAPVQTMLGAEQRAWFLERLGASRATWKVWANSQGTLDARADPQNSSPGPHAALARGGLREPRRRRSQQRLRGARGHLRSRRARRPHRIRHGLGRPAQLLGGPRRQGAATGALRARRRRVHHRIRLGARVRRGLRARLASRAPATRALPGRPPRAGEARAGGEPPPAPRRARVPRVRALR